MRASTGCTRSWPASSMSPECSRAVRPALEHDRLRIVEEQLPRSAPEKAQRSQNRATERLRRHVQDELGVPHPRIRQKHHEDPECPHASRDCEVPNVPPVHLTLLAR